MIEFRDEHNRWSFDCDPGETEGDDFRLEAEPVLYYGDTPPEGDRWEEVDDDVWRHTGDPAVAPQDSAEEHRRYAE